MEQRIVDSCGEKYCYLEQYPWINVFNSTFEILEIIYPSSIGLPGEDASKLQFFYGLRTLFARHNAPLQDWIKTCSPPHPYVRFQKENIILDTRGLLDRDTTNPDWNKPEQDRISEEWQKNSRRTVDLVKDHGRDHPETVEAREREENARKEYMAYRKTRKITKTDAQLEADQRKLQEINEFAKHITLAFLEKQPEGVVQSIIEELSSITEDPLVKYTMYMSPLDTSILELRGGIPYADGTYIGSGFIPYTNTKITEDMFNEETPTAKRYELNWWKSRNLTQGQKHQLDIDYLRNYNIHWGVLDVPDGPDGPDVPDEPEVLNVGRPLVNMPQLCLGTVQGNAQNVKDYITEAIRLGYRHIDTALAYRNMVEPRGGLDYFDAVREGLKNGLTAEGLRREDLWITYKADHLTEDIIEEFIKKTGVEYIDLMLVHHGCGNQRDSRVLRKLLQSGAIKRWGVSNCEDLENLVRIRDKIPEHPLYVNQIQALPPGVTCAGRNRHRDIDLTEEINKLGIHTMLFSPINGFTSNMDNAIALTDPETTGVTIDGIMEYYLAKYIHNTENVLIVGTRTGSTLASNLELFNEVVERDRGIDSTRMEAILQKYTYEAK